MTIISDALKLLIHVIHIAFQFKINQQEILTVYAWHRFDTKLQKKINTVSIIIKRLHTNSTFNIQTGHARYFKLSTSNSNDLTATHRNKYAIYSLRILHTGVSYKNQKKFEC